MSKDFTKLQHIYTFQSKFLLLQFLSFSSQSNFYRNRFTRNEVYRKQQSQNIDNKWKLPFLAYELQFIWMSNQVN